MIFETPPLRAWSYSRLEVFERCPYRAQLEFVDKADQGHDPKRDAALQKGLSVHQDAEKYVKGELPELPKSLEKFAKEFERRRELYATNPEMLTLEENWAFDTDWQATEWFGENAWFRMKLDIGEWLDAEKTAMFLRDYKTGKKEGNEVKHGQQKQLFTLGVFMRYPSVQVVKGQMEYLDHGKVDLPKTYSREQAMSFLPSFEQRGRALTEATNFPPKPNRINCAYCPFGPSKGNGFCEYGVEA